MVISKNMLSKKLPVLKSPKKQCDIRGGCYDNFNKKLGVYVINCKMHSERLGKFQKYTERAGIKACRIPCVLGKKFSDKSIAKMVKNNIIKKNCDMNKIELSINMSHYNCWQKFLNSCQDYALIIEDDAEVKFDFTKNVNLIIEKLEQNNINFSILHLWNGNWVKTISKQNKILKINNKIQIMRENVIYNAGAVAYIISKKYAEWLTNPKRFFPIKMPQDMLMGNFPKIGNHLTLKMKYNKKQQCYKSPLININCGGEGGTGNTTQEYSAPTIKEILKKF